MPCVSINPAPTSIKRFSEEFLNLFPYRFGFIYAVHPVPGQKPIWFTESEYPLTDRAIQDGQYLYGVRFGKQTQYLMLDIDAGSPYHPSRNRRAIGEIISTLAPIGIYDYFATSSSDSGGIHIWLPLSESVNSHEIAQAATFLIEGSGYKCQDGTLELYPNPRIVRSATPESNFKAHRLPLQNGSYILDRDFNRHSNLEEAFLVKWHQCQRHNEIDLNLIRQLAKKYRARIQSLTSSKAKYKHDLEADYAPGFTSPGRTNFLRGKVAKRLHIFGDPITGERLTAAQVGEQTYQILKASPGYEENCNHKHNLRKLCIYSARSVARKHWYHEDRSQPKSSKIYDSARVDCSVNGNQIRQQSARAKIANARITLEMAGKFPDTINERAKAIVKYGISRKTLYAHKDLWHPDHSTPSATPVENAETLTQHRKFPPCQTLLEETDLNPLPSKEVSTFPLISFSADEQAERRPPRAGRDSLHQLNKLSPVATSNENALEGYQFPDYDESIWDAVEAATEAKMRALENEYAGIGAKEIEQVVDQPCDSAEDDRDLEKLQANYYALAEQARIDGLIRDVVWCDAPGWKCQAVIYLNGAMLPLEEWGDRQKERSRSIPMLDNS